MLSSAPTLTLTLTLTFIPTFSEVTEHASRLYTVHTAAGEGQDTHHWRTGQGHSVGLQHDEIIRQAVT